jgi:hypothetical protein
MPPAERDDLEADPVGIGEERRIVVVGLLRIERRRRGGDSERREPRGRLVDLVARVDTEAQMVKPRSRITRS